MSGNHTLKGAAHLSSLVEKSHKYADLVSVIKKHDGIVHMYSNSRVYYGMTMLHVCARNNDLRGAKLLLEKNAEPNARDCDGKSPLFYTTDTRVAKLLLDHKADVNILSNGNTQLVEHALDEQRDELLKLYLEHGAELNRIVNGTTLLHVSSVLYTQDKMALLIKHKADVNARDSLGRTPLFVVSHLSRMEYLLEHKANPNAEDYNGNIAVYRHSYEAIELLLKHGLDPNKVHLKHASFNGNVLDLLLRYGLDPYLEDRNGQTPLHKAALCPGFIYAPVDGVKLLLEHITKK